MFYYEALLTTLLVLTLTHAGSYFTNAQQSSSRSGEEYLDSAQAYLLKWNVSLTEKRIYFEVTAKTTGYVGFGISMTGGMTNSDIFIAGVHQNGSSYSSDRHATGKSTPILDSAQDCVLTSASETDNHTTISFNRLLNTCDAEEDYPITYATARLIYAMGEADAIEFHGLNKGTKSINFFLEDDSTFDPQTYDTFDIIAESVMPKQDTTYWCTFHRVLPFSEKNHVVAFEPILEGELALRHTHHFNLFKCVAPEGKNPDELFGPFVGQEGRHCFDSPANSDDFPMEYCRRHSLYVWSKGGKWTIFPSDVGFPVPDVLNENEYYQLETHFDNPNNLSNLVIKSGLRAYHTKELRQHDAGMLLVNHEISPSLTVPVTDNFVTSGHCSSTCTENEIPEGGITLFNNLFHSHLAGRKMKLRHFRGKEELQWIDVDDFYDFDYQQSKPLSMNVKLQRVDQLTVECTYDTSKNGDGKIVVGGLSTHEEMCEAILWYYPKTDFVYCGSSQDVAKHFQLFGVTEFTTKNDTLAGGIAAYEIIAPENLAGYYIESTSHKFNWTQEFRDAYQKEKTVGEHKIICLGKDLIVDGTVKYPENVVAYVPEDECALKRDNNGSSRNTVAVTFVVVLQVCTLFMIVL